MSDSIPKEVADGDRIRCEYLTQWNGASPGFCGTLATKRYPVGEGCFMYLCDEHSIKHLNYAEVAR